MKIISVCMRVAEFHLSLQTYFCLRSDVEGDSKQQTASHISFPFVNRDISESTRGSRFYHCV